MRARPLNAPSSSGTILDHVGQTPLVPLRRIFAGELSGRVEIWAKLEAFNPSGSVKARAALNIILEAEKSGRLEPGGTLLDASSGNTGIAYAMIAAARGYRLKLCLPANANHERKQILKAYGVELIITSPLEGSDGAIHKAKALAAENPDWFTAISTATTQTGRRTLSTPDQKSGPNWVDGSPTLWPGWAPQALLWVSAGF